MTPTSRPPHDPASAAWAAFRRHDAQVAAPPETRARVHRSAAAWMAASPQATPAPRLRRPAWQPVAVAAALAAAVVAAVWSGPPGRALPNPGSAPGPIATRRGGLPWTASPGSVDMIAPAPPRPRLARVEPARPVADPVRPVAGPSEAPAFDDRLQVVRVRVDAAALASFGVQVAGPLPAGLVDVDLVVGGDGWPRDVRRIRPVLAAGPPE
jgi:hypothetical protein